MIGVKWIYMLKFNSNGVFADRKYRIVAKRYLQVQEVDFEEMYATTMYLELFWLLLVIVVSLKLYLWQLDFVMAYFNNDIDIDIYMEQPLDFAEEEGNIV